MRYNNIKEGRFIIRPNRFIAEIMIDGKKETAHVKNTGRCKEILQRDAAIYLEKAHNKNRKTSWSIISAKKGNEIINIDSQIPNRVFEEALYANKIKIKSLNKLRILKREQTYKHSRFDFYYKTDIHEGFIEIKGVTLKQNGIARFPDAPTLRGRRHIEELIEANNDNYRSLIIFIIQMQNVNIFEPNYQTDPDFSNILIKAKEAGIGIYAYNCIIEPDSIYLNKKVKVLI